MKEHTLYKIEDMLCEELEDVAKEEHLNASSLQILDTALHATKNLYKIMDSMDGASYAMSGGNSSYYSRRGGSYSRDDGSYRGGGYSREGGSYARGYSRDGGSYRGYKRDSMGRFSRSEGGSNMVERLKDMMNETEDSNEKADLQEFITSIEHRG